jgi:hypothetical protein
MKVSKEQAPEYIKKRYPDQTLIHDEYLKPREPMVIKNV